MSVSDVMIPNNVDASRLTFAPPKLLDNGGKSVFIYYNEKSLIVQTPEMIAPFGVSVWPGERGGPDKYKIDLSFRDRESRPSLQAFFNMLTAIGERLVTEAMENSQSWFKRPRFPSRDVVEALYTHIIRFSKDKETGEINNMYAPVFKMNLHFRDGVFQCPVYDAQRNPINMLDLVNSETRGKGSRVQAIVQLGAVWLAGGKFGVTWKVCQLRLSEPARLNNYAFQATEDDDFLEQGDEPAAAVNKPLRNKTSGGGGLIEDDHEGVPFSARGAPHDDDNLDELDARV